MTDNPLHIIFLWHMHQPYYKDPTTGLYRLPWVRLHGTKDYLDMLEILKDFPAVKQNFNLVPSLLEQLVDYAEHDAGDVYLEMSGNLQPLSRQKNDYSFSRIFFLLTGTT